MSGIVGLYNARDVLAVRFGEALDRRMAEEGMTHSQCAALLGVTYQHVWKMRSGRGLPGPEVICRLRRKLGIDLNALFDGIEGF